MLIHDKLKRLYKSVQRPVESAWTVYLVEKWRALARKLGYQCAKCKDACYSQHLVSYYIEFSLQLLVILNLIQFKAKR